MTNRELNSNAWEVCQFSKKESELKDAVKWAAQVLQTEKDSSNMLPASMDTYGCLLYRLGDTAKAIEIIEGAVNIAGKYNNPSIYHDEKKGLKQ